MAHCPTEGCPATLNQPDSACQECRETISWCSRCGGANRIRARYCRLCGTRLLPKTEWRLPRGDAQASGYLPVAIPFTTAVEESDRLDLNGPVRAQAVAGQGHIFVSVGGLGVVVLHQSDCRRVAVAAAEGNIFAIALSDAFLLTAGDKGLQAFALDDLLAGRLVPPRTLLGQTVSQGRGPTIVVENDLERVFVASAQAIHGVALGEAGRDWAASRIGRGSAALLMLGNMLICVEESGHMLALDPATGDVRWQHSLGEEVQTRTVCASPDMRIYTVGRRGVLKVTMAGKDRAVSLDTVHRFLEVHSLAAGGRELFVTGAGGVHRCSPSDPRIWTMANEIVTSPLLVTEGTVFACTSHGSLLQLDAAAEGGRHLVKSGRGSSVVAAPLLAGNRLFVISENGILTVYRVGKEGGAA